MLLLLYSQEKNMLILLVVTDRRQVGRDVMVVRKKISAPARYQIILTQPTARYYMNTGHIRI
jgi:hypothetical protein